MLRRKFTRRIEHASGGGGGNRFDLRAGCSGAKRFRWRHRVAVLCEEERH